MKIHRKETRLPALVLDGGALLFDGAHLPAAREAQAKATAEGIVKAYNLMGYDAAGISRIDLAGGLSFLQELAGRSDFAWLSANLVDTGGQPIFKTHIIKKAAGLSAGIIGLTADGAPLPGVVILPWQEVLSPLVKGLQDSTDLIILLADLPEEKIREITSALPEIDLIIQAEGHPTNFAPPGGSGPMIFRTASQGKYLGILEIDWQKNIGWGGNRQELLRKKKQDFDQLSWQLRRQPSSPELKEKRQLLSNEIAALEKGAEGSSFNNRFLALQPSLPDDPDVLAVTANIGQQIHQIGKKIAQDQENAAGTGPSLAASFPYAGWQACGQCHPGHVKQWQQTNHARAYQTLATRNQQFNLDCLSCHVTGQDALPAEVIFPPADLQAVGCESCHGPGRQHADAPRQKPVVRKPPAETCLQCHTPERDYSFDYHRDLPRALHRD